MGSGSNGAENARSRPRKQASGKESTVSAKRCIEVVLVVGNYTQLTMFQNTLGVQLPPDIEGLPEAPATR